MMTHLPCIPYALNPFESSSYTVTTQIFQELKISSCIHGILHTKVFSKVLNLIPSKNIVSMPSSQILETKGFQKESILKMNSIVVELSYILV
jgi:hypothetical protein